MSGKISMRLDARRKVFFDVNRERYRQDVLWGEQNHDPHTWLAVLTEEVGEYSAAVLNEVFEKKTLPPGHTMRDELVQVAAVAVAAIESLDRAKWKWGSNATPATAGGGEG